MLATETICTNIWYHNKGKNRPIDCQTKTFYCSFNKSVNMWTVNCLNSWRFLSIFGPSSPVFFSPDFLELSLNINMFCFQRDYRIVGLAVDIGRNFLFWSDISNQYRGVYRSDIHGNDIVRIVDGMSVCLLSVPIIICWHIVCFLKYSNSKKIYMVVPIKLITLQKRHA